MRTIPGKTYLQWVEPPVVSRFVMALRYRKYPLRFFGRFVLLLLHLIRSVVRVRRGSIARHIGPIVMRWPWRRMYGYTIDSMSINDELYVILTLFMHNGEQAMIGVGQAIHLLRLEQVLSERISFISERKR